MDATRGSLAPLMITLRFPRRRLAALAFLPLAALGLAMLPHAPRPARSTDGGQHYPSDWFYAQRAFPSGAIDHDAVLAAVDQAARDRRRVGRASAGPAWQPADASPARRSAAEVVRHEVVTLAAFQERVG